jgi:UDP-3-O-[3-hydroxymyristoyl] glucosamine N-acyltransferase
VNSLYGASKHEIAFCIKDAIIPGAIHAGALIVHRKSQINYPNLIFVDHPYVAFSQLLDFFFPHQPFCQGIDPRASVSKNSNLGKDVSVGAFSYVGQGCEIGDHTEIHAGVMIYRDVKIGKHCIIYANSVIREDVEIGEHTIIQPGAIIGADGFGFTRNADGTILKIPQKGRVIIGKYCEIGANTCIDRSTIENTIIGDYVKTDNLIQIGHNVTIGSNSMLSAQTGISGSTEIGADVVMGGQVGIGDHLKIADGVMMAGKTGVTGNIKDKCIVAGYPHQEIRKWRREQVLMRNLEHHIERIKILEEKVKKLEGK